jgi:uncharacterized protein
VLDCGGFADAWQSSVRQFGAFEPKQLSSASREAQLSPKAEADPVLKAALSWSDLRSSWSDLRSQ